MEIQTEGIVIIVGNYGSGKTEVAVNLAVQRRLAGVEVRLADLDLVNPYFRTREARHQLAALGIDIVLPAEKYLNADLPILSPEVAGLIRNPAQLTILDAGGDDVGATVLAALNDALSTQPFKMLQVVNPHRPFTETVEGCLRVRREIEAAARQPVSGLIGNANLIDETTPDDVYRGVDFLRRLSKESGLAVEFVTIPAQLTDRIDARRVGFPRLPIRRQLVPPWKQAIRLPGIVSNVAAAAKNEQGV